jgi:metal-dependent hydrolase (beta-lactamase superfamily II)
VDLLLSAYPIGHGFHSGNLLGKRPYCRVCQRKKTPQKFSRTFTQPDHSPILNNRWLSGIMILIIAGCSHPGVGCIIIAASTFGKVSTLIGGLHSFDGCPLIDGLDAIYPAYCTRHIDDIKRHYPQEYRPAGAGQVANI